MRTAKVITLAISAPGKKIFRSGDTVKESQFEKGRFDKLIEGKYIEVFSETEEPVKNIEISGPEVTKTDAPVTDDNSGSGDDTKDPDDSKDDDSKDDQKDESIDDTTVKELKVELTKMGVEFSANSTKAELYEIWRANKKE